MEIIFELAFGIIAEFLQEVLFQAVVEFVFALGLESIANTFKPQRRSNPLLAALGLLLLGGIVGLVGALVLSKRLLPTGPLPGVSLLLSPLAVGTLMHLFGNWRRSRGAEPSALATFWGGALFAFAMASVRWLMVAGA